MSEYTKKDLTAMKYADVKAIATEYEIPISRPDGGGRRSKAELVELILEVDPDDFEEDDDGEDEEELYLEDMSRKELKALAKELGLSASGKKDALVARIAEYYEDEDDEEEFEDEDDDDEDDYEDEEEIELSLDDLEGMTVKELKALGEELGIEELPRRKAQIIDAIVDFASEEEDEDDEDEDDEDYDEDEDEDEVVYEDLTRSELKALAGARNLPTSGSKKALIARLEADDAQDDDDEEDWDDDEDEPEAEEVASVSGPTGPVEVMMADSPVGAAFIVTRVSADKWTITPTSADGVVVQAGAGTLGVVADNYDTLSRSELKDLLRTRGLKIGGRKDAQIARLRQFDVESATTGVTKKFRGRAYNDEVQSDAYKEFKEQSRSKDYKAMKKWAKKEGAEWEAHSDERIDRIRLTTALREALGVEKYKEEYQDAAARKAIKA